MSLFHSKITLAPVPPALQDIPATVDAAPSVAPSFDAHTNADFLALNADQQATVQNVFSFLLSSSKEFQISGPAGVGKTHLMKFIMQHTLKEYKMACQILGKRHVDFTIALCATTNKAAEVLTQATSFPASTIHSFMSLKIKDNYSTGKSDIQKTRDWKVHHNTLIFIDEASMIDADLHEYIKQGTDSTCKIIYLGDACQMAPVFEEISPIYANPTNVSTLSIPMRNSGQPALMALCNQLRDTVKTGVFQPIDEVPGAIDHVDDQQAFDFVNVAFLTPEPTARILAYSNLKVQEYNRFIRNLRGLPATFVEGERLINNSSIPLNVGDNIFNLAIESEIEILKINSAPYTVWASDDLNSDFDVYDVEFAVIGHKGAAGTRFRKQLPVNHDRVDQLIKAFAKRKNWERYFYMKKDFPDFRQRDASTVYKAQGSTHETIFLDLTNIGSCTNNSQLARMLYVGASRATTRLLTYGALPKRLFI